MSVSLDEQVETEFSCETVGEGREATRRLLQGIVLAGLLLFSGCGSLTGLPGHGGGKRFAVEQELVAAATRATIKKIDLSDIKGRKVNLYLNAIDDTGSGNLVGGRYSLVSQVRGDYIHTPTVTEKSVFPRYDSTTTTQSSSRSTNSSTGSSTGANGDVSTTESSGSTSSSSSNSSTTSTLLNTPEKTTSSQKGHGGEVQIGVEYKGLGAYRNSEELSTNDMQYLNGLLQTYLFLQGVKIVPPSEAEVDVYVIVDVFGTVRSRIEWFIANNEILRAKTALEVMAVDHRTGELLMPPQSASVEAEYNEQYLLWAGPIMITKYLKKASPLLTDFTDLETVEEASYAEQSGPIPYPFRHQVEKMGRDD